MKKKISITIEDTEAKKLSVLAGYTSPIVSILIKKFFEKVTVNDLWQAMEMDKPKDVKDRIKKLETFMEGLQIITQKKTEKNIEKISPWGDFGIEKK